MDVSPSYVDGGEFTSEVASTMRRCFDHFDADGDGALSHAEFSGVYQCECAATAAAPPPSPSPPAAARHWHGLCAHTGWPLSGRMLFNQTFTCVWHKPMQLSHQTRAQPRAHTQTLNRQPSTHTYIPSPSPPPATHTHTHLSTSSRGPGHRRATVSAGPRDGCQGAVCAVLPPVPCHLDVHL